MKNENYFKCIDSQEKAYWFGFFCADGYNNQQKGQVTLSLGEKDSDMVKRFADIFGAKVAISKSKITNRTDMHYTTICSKEISNDLGNLGAIQRKSLVIKLPEINKELFNHYLRGYWDGDGCIYVKNRSDGALVIDSLAVCSNDMAKQIKYYMNSRLGIHVSCQNLGKNKLTTTIKTSGSTNNAIFLPFLYKNAEIFMQRKFDKYQTFMNEFSSRILRKYTTITQFQKDESILPASLRE